MGQANWERRCDLIRQLFQGQLSLATMAERLAVSLRTIRRYRARFLAGIRYGLKRWGGLSRSTSSRLNPAPRTVQMLKPLDNSDVK
jgi:hypothetical protein